MSHAMPSASMATLKARARLLAQLRQFMVQQNVLEVEVPLLGFSTITDPFIDTISVPSESVTGRKDNPAEAMFLQTSPEYYLKRLLCAEGDNAEPIYALSKCFRQGETSSRHNPEFTMLEWYMPDWDEHQLMQQLEALIMSVLGDIPVEKVAYGELLQQILNIDPHQASAADVEQAVKARCDIAIDDLDKDGWLDLAMTHIVEPALPKGLVFIHDYPASQCALAELDNNAQGQMIARRFEAYVNGMELANGYYELTDPTEQRQRFEADNTKRKGLGLCQKPIDEKLLTAMTRGLPRCSGVAMGVDRLFMQTMAFEQLSSGISFSVSHS